MKTTVQDPVVLLLSKGDTASARNNTNGHLFESFVAQIMHLYGYGQPRVRNLNVTAEGAELDIELTHEMNGHTAVAECKAYSSPISIDKLTSFYGDLAVRRLEDPKAQGYFVASPRLTANAHEKAEVICRTDKLFRVVEATDIWDLLVSRDKLFPADVPGIQTSDPAIVVHSSGLYSAALEIDPETKTASRVVVSGIPGFVNKEALSLLADHNYSQSLPVVDLYDKSVSDAVPAAAPPLIVEVRGSTSDFEYQLPASPKYFVGRRSAVKKLSELLKDHSGPFVLNAQSGWGKSSLALKLATSVTGIGLVVDSRTAEPGTFIPSALHRAFLNAEAHGIVKLDQDASWATVHGSIRSIEAVKWQDRADSRIVVIFDQFENTFRDEHLTREFRDLALWNAERGRRVSIGFAWKTDFVDWTENHPFQLRDQIRGCSTVVNLEPFGSREVDTILTRLDKHLGERLSREIRQRLREYSQGLPWLLKKLAGHLIDEIASGKTQEQLVAEALNVQNLFESDMAALSPSERDALSFVARYAPVQAQEVSDRFSAGLVQSLLDQRLLVQVGEKLDTYWDTFRDFVVTGNVPIEESYIIRQTPRSVGRLISEVLQRGGDAAVTDIAQSWETTENVVWNNGRELRQLGLAASVPNRIQLIPELISAEDVELELRGRIARVLRRHRAFTAFCDVCERGQGVAHIPEFANRLRAVFPAVEGTDNTWNTYARTFVAWFAYAGLVKIVAVNVATVAPEDAPGWGNLLDTGVRRKLRTVFPSSSPGPVIKWVVAEFGGGMTSTQFPRSQAEREVAAQAIALGAVHVGGDDRLHVFEGLLSAGQLEPPQLLRLLKKASGGQECIDELKKNPATAPEALGSILAAANEVDWAKGTKWTSGKAFRGWARAAGIRTERIATQALTHSDTLPGV